MVAAVEDDPPGGGGLVGVPGAHDVEPRDGAQRGQVLDGLVGGPVLADPDGVVRPHEDRVDAHEGGQAHGRAHVVGEDHEGPAVGAGQAVQGDAVEDAAHGVLAHSEVHGAPVGAVALLAGQRGGQEGGLARHGRVVGAGQVRGPAPQLGNDVGQGGQGPAGGGPGGQGLADLPGGQGLGQALGEAAGAQPLQEGGALGLGGPPGLEAGVPVGPGRGGALGGAGTGAVQEVVGGVEVLRGVQAQGLLEPGDLLRAELGAVAGGLALLVGGRPGDHGVQADEGGAGRLGAGGGQGGAQGGVVLLVAGPAAGPVHVQDLPAVGGEAGGGVLGEGQVGAALDGDVVVVVDGDEVAQLLGPGQGGGLGGHALLQAAVAHDRVDVVVEDGVPGRGGGVEQAVLEPGGHGHADGVGEAGAERARRGLHARGVPELRVPRGAGPPLAQLLQVRDLQAVAGQDQLDVQQEGGVPGGQDEAVAPQPAGVGGVVGHLVLVEQVGDAGQGDGGPRVPGSGLLDGVRRQGLGDVDGPEVFGGQCLGVGAHAELLRDESGRRGAPWTGAREDPPRRRRRGQPAPGTDARGPCAAARAPTKVTRRNKPARSGARLHDRRRRGGLGCARARPAGRSTCPPVPGGSRSTSGRKLDGGRRVVAGTPLRAHPARHSAARTTCFQVGSPLLWRIQSR